MAPDLKVEDLDQEPIVVGGALRLWTSPQTVRTILAGLALAWGIVIWTYGAVGVLMGAKDVETYAQATWAPVVGLIGAVYTSMFGVDRLTAAVGAVRKKLQGKGDRAEAAEEEEG